jgi:hypothetical protein
VAYRGRSGPGARPISVSLMDLGSDKRRNTPTRDPSTRAGASQSMAAVMRPEGLKADTRRSLKQRGND